ncbi:acetyltransferase [Gramella sp. KN1008]|uniref:acetyltransferase n=1 Tax=Gramella sp. KN1008 TaxID=2529298 RepID=UPI0010394055|nr:acetyltransferase [Gramella sp. KN1008]TBW26613.1 acetyltransferase [Gramella sp. KN1008]
MLSNKIAILGYSGHGLVVADAAIQQGISLKYYLEKKPVSFNPFNLQYLGDENGTSFKGWDEIESVIIGIGDNHIRKKVVDSLPSKNLDFLNIIHPDSSFSEILELGKGNFISRNVSINAGVEIGNHCILNTSAVIEHECLIGNFVHVAPGATLAGNVKVGESTFIGANSVIKQGIEVGKNVIVGAGSVVIRDISDGEKWVGNPARKI